MKQTLVEGVDSAAPRPREKTDGEKKIERGKAAGCHVWDRRVTDLSFHTLIKSHPGVLDAFQ